MYHLTVHRGHSVLKSLKGNFLDPNELNLLLNKGTHFEIYRVVNESLELVTDVPVYGRIATFQLYRPLNSQTDWLIFTTEKYQLSVVYWKDRLVTHAVGSIKDPRSRPSETGQMSTISDDGSIIAYYQTQGLLKMVPVKKQQFGEAFNVRLDKLLVLDIKFLWNNELGILYQDAKDQKHFMTFTFKDKELYETDVDHMVDEPCFMIPTLNGVLIVGKNTIYYYNGDMKSVSIKPTEFKCFEKITEERFLLGDERMLYVLVLPTLSLDEVVEIVSPTDLTYLDNGLLFVSSHFNDSQLLRLLDKSVVDSITNLSPISDFCVVDLENQGQGQIVACSGAYKDGSIRIIRNGVGINEIGLLENIGELKNLFSIGEDYDKLLILSFMQESRFYLMNQALEEMEPLGFSSEPTLACGKSNDDYIQVTHSGAYWVDKEFQRVKTFEAAITHASIHRHVIVASSNVLMDLSTNHQMELEFQVSCLDTFEDKVAVGFWTDHSMAIYQLPEFKCIAKHPLSQVVPRSICLAPMTNLNVFVALGDGELYSFVLNDKLELMKKMSIGNGPIQLTRCHDAFVFASCERPTFIYPKNNKLVFANVNLKGVSCMTPFYFEENCKALAFGTCGDLLLGTIETMQKLHIKTIPMGQTLRRIIYSNQLFFVLGQSDLWQVQVFDTNFKMLDSFKLGTNEVASSICSFKVDQTTLYIVGTGYTRPFEDEPTSGRLLVFHYSNHLELIHESRIQGCAYSIQSVRSKLVVAVNSKVLLYHWNGSALDMQYVHHGHVVALTLAVRGDYILVGDLMKSISVLLLSSDQTSLQEIARDYEAHWMTAIAALEDDVYVGAESNYNLFYLEKKSDAQSDQERRQLVNMGRFHIGEMVNQFHPGSLVMHSEFNTQLLYCTVNGSIGALLKLSKEHFELLQRIQTKLLDVIPGVGGLDHATFRQFQNDLNVFDSTGFIDGDLVELFLELSQEQQQQVAGKDLQTVFSLIDDLSRIH